MKIARWAETHYINLALHNPLGPVSTAACLHLDIACSNFGVQECPRIPGTTMTDVFPVQVEWEDGYLLLPERPGLGVEFDEQGRVSKVDMWLPQKKLWGRKGWEEDPDPVRRWDAWADWQRTIYLRHFADLQRAFGYNQSHIGSTEVDWRYRGQYAWG